MNKKREAIIQVLRRDGPLRAKDLENHKVIKKNVKSTYHYIKSLLREGQIKRLKGSDFYSIYFLPEQEDKAREKYSEEYGDKIDVSKEHQRYLHSKKIIEEIIKPWLEELPDLTVNTFPKFMEPGITPATQITSRLAVESHVLFEDFRNHIAFSPNPYDEFDKLRKLAKEFLTKKHRIYYGLHNFYGPEIEDLPIIENETNEFTEKEEQSAEKFGYLTECQSIIVDVRNSIWKDLFSWYQYDFDEDIFDDIFVDDSHVEEKEKTLEYYLGSVFDGKGIFLGSIEKNKMDKEQFQRIMDKSIKNIYGKIKASKDDFEDKMDELQALQNNIFSSLRELRRSLEQHSNDIILPGDCSYISE